MGRLRDGDWDAALHIIGRTLDGDWVGAQQDVIGRSLDGDWAVQVEDGTHTIRARLFIIVRAQLTITWDGVEIESSRRWWLLGTLKSFEHNGHSFVLKVRGLGALGNLVLYMDGVEVPGVISNTPPSWQAEG